MKTRLLVLFLSLISLSAFSQTPTYDLKADTVRITKRLKVANLYPSALTDSLVGHKANGNLTKIAPLSGFAMAANQNFTGTIGLPSTTSIGGVSSTELSYVDGVTSPIQTQFNTLSSNSSHSLFQTAGFRGWVANYGAVSYVGVGIVAPSSVNTAARNVDDAAFSTAPFLRDIERITHSSTATANTTGNTRHSVKNFVIRKGFYITGTFAVTDPTASVATGNLFIGLLSSGSAQAVGVNPGTWAQSEIAIGNDATDANLQIFTNNGGATATKTDLGVNFPSAGTTASMTAIPVYTFTLSCPANGTAVTYTVIRKSSVDGSVIATATGTITGTLPATTTSMALQVIKSNMGTPSISSVDVSAITANSIY